MSKTIRGLFDSKITYDAFYNAFLRACKNKKGKNKVIKFTIDLESNLYSLMRDVKSDNYFRGEYHEFFVYEPKERLIKALPFRDRVLHQWYVHEFIKPFIVKRFISTTYACLDERGTHKAVLKLQEYMRWMKRGYGEYYVIKCDVKKFFYNINRNILFDIMNNYIGEEKLLNLTRKLIFDTEDIKGIPIGNYTSQYFANIYLNELDYFVKFELKIRCYVRYMDDFVLLVKNREEARKAFNEIDSFLRSRLDLELNRKSRYYPNKFGINFCGYRIFETHRLIRNGNKRKIGKKVNKWKKLFYKGNLDLKKLELQFNSWKGHISHANSFNLYTKVYSTIKDFFEL